MRESYCGLCDDCQLGHPGFLETVSRLKDLPGTGPGQRLAPLLPRAGGFQPAGVQKGAGMVPGPHGMPRLPERAGPGRLPHPGLRPGPAARPLLSMPGPGALRQVRPAPGAVSRREGQPAPPPVEVQGQGIPPEAGRGEEVEGPRRKGNKSGTVSSVAAAFSRRLFDREMGQKPEWYGSAI